MARVRLFGPLVDVAGTREVRLSGSRVGDVLGAAGARFGEEFVRLLETSRIWVNGNPAAPDDLVADDDELAILPPVSGGAS